MIRRAVQAASTAMLLGALLGALATGAAHAALPLDAARAELTRTQGEVARLQGVRTVLTAELRGLSDEIEALKSRGERGGLDERLRRNQELAYRLGTLARELAAAENQMEARRSDLLQTLSENLTNLQAQWERTDDTKVRQQLVTQMRALRSEREAARIPFADAAPPLPAPGPVRQSDDPEELQQQADALRDAEDKVRQRLQLVETRITEARQERDLDRRMGHFLGEESLFDDHDRRFRARPASSGAVAASPSADSAAPASAEGAGAPLGGGPPAQAAVGPRELPSSGVGSAMGLAADSANAEASEAIDLRALESQRAELKAAAEQLRARATQFELRARQLR